MGPFYFAWIADGTVEFDPAEHARQDLVIFSFDLTHEEGQFAQITLDVENPRIGLLSTDRDVWGIVSFDMTGAGDSGGGIVPLCKGRLIGLPNDLQSEIIQLQFVARPDNYGTQKLALAEAMKVRPYWDPIWLTPERLADPDNVLEARPELWHVDPVTHVLTSSDIINGEDGTLNFGEADIFYDSLKISLGQSPARRIVVNASVNWDQNAAGLVDIHNFFQSGGYGSIWTYMGDGLVSNWPKEGAKLGPGWSASSSIARRADGVAGNEWGFEGQYADGSRYYTFQLPWSEHYMELIVPHWWTESHYSAFGAGGTTVFFPAHKLRVPRQRIIAGFEPRYDVSRKKSETLSFILESDIQPIITEPGDDDDTLELSLSSGEVVSLLDPDPSGIGLMPLGDQSASVYFSTKRGRISLEYVIAMARAQLLARARVVKIAFEIPWATALDAGLSCRKSVVIEDYRIPGGIAGGKIVSYTLHCDGDSGEMSAQITMACTIGKGNTVEPVPGTPTYCVDYVAPGYQRYEGKFDMPIPGAVLYEDIEGLPANDDGIDFKRMTAARCVRNFSITNTWNEQEDAMEAMRQTVLAPKEVIDRVNELPTTLTLELISIVGGPFETLWNPAVSQLMIPKLIDLEAPAS